MSNTKVPYMYRRYFTRKIKETLLAVQKLKDVGDWWGASHLEFQLRNCWWGYKLINKRYKL
jgi:hypothetical protein